MNILYTGKAKTIYLGSDSEHVILEFRDDISAFNGIKLAQLPNKGIINNYFNAAMMKFIAQSGIKTHFEKLLTPQTSSVKRLEMLPLEAVVRNIAAGGICKRLGVAEGSVLPFPIFEFYLKNDALGDPPINEYHIRAFNWASNHEVEEIKALSFKINEMLSAYFKKVDLLLVDFKLEFGRYQDQLFLGDEFTLDGCRVWDNQTQEKLDKDRFRHDLGNVIEAYQDVCRRLAITLPVLSSAL